MKNTVLVLLSVLFLLLLTGCSPNESGSETQPPESTLNGTETVEAGTVETTPETVPLMEVSLNVGHAYFTDFCIAQRGRQGQVANTDKYWVPYTMDGEEGLLFVEFDVHRYRFYKGGVEDEEHEVRLTAEEMDRIVGVKFFTVYYPCFDPDPIDYRKNVKELIRQYTLEHDGTCNEDKSTYTWFDEYNGEKGKFVLNLSKREYTFTKNSRTEKTPRYDPGDAIHFTAKEMDALLGYGKSILTVFYDNEK